jgi:hypothetical protein
MWSIRQHHADRAARLISGPVIAHANPIPAVNEGANCQEHPGWNSTKPPEPQGKLLEVCDRANVVRTPDGARLYTPQFRSGDHIEHYRLISRACQKTGCRENWQLAIATRGRPASASANFNSCTQQCLPWRSTRLVVLRCSSPPRAVRSPNDNGSVTLNHGSDDATLRGVSPDGYQIVRTHAVPIVREIRGGCLSASPASAGDFGNCGHCPGVDDDSFIAVPCLVPRCVAAAGAIRSHHRGLRGSRARKSTLARLARS